MRLDGALEPHHGAPAIGSSFGAKKYRDKRCESRAKASVRFLENSINYQREYTIEKNNNNSSGNSITTKGKVDGSAPPEQRPLEYNCSNIENLQPSSTKNNQTENSPTNEPSNVNNNNSQNNATSQGNRDNSLHVASLLLLWSPLSHCCLLAVSAATKIMRLQSALRTATAAVPCTAVQLVAAWALVAQNRFSSNLTPLRTQGLRCSAMSLFVMCVLGAAALLPVGVTGDDSDTFFAVNSFSMGPIPETTTPEFDYASRGKKKFGDKCDNTLECGFPGSICDPKKKSCQCTEDLPVTNHIDKCGKEAAVNESCFFNEQCESKYFQTECRDGKCVCRFEMSPIWGKDGSVECKGRQEKRGTETYIDPAMIGVLVGMALMFIIICVVLRLFSQARWRENRTIFNTPNPRLMNVSLLRDSKLLHGQERRGSRMSVRAPSRQPSMASLRPHSPNPSLGKTGSRSGSGSNASATSLRSTRSNSVAPGNVNGHGHHERKGSAHHHHHHHHQQPQEQPLMAANITANPAADSVTVEIIEPAK